MLEHVPDWLGSAMRGFRAGHEKLTVARPELSPGRAPAAIALSSPAFAAGSPMPPRFTADGAGVSPPLAWRGVPSGARALALVVEDPDAPTPEPLVHAILWGIAPEDGALAEGAIAADRDAAAFGIGRNSYLKAGWLPPDPPTGHGPHAYVFQLFALSEGPEIEAAPGRRALIEAMAGGVIGVGLLTATYVRA